jgi:hypothetical protein
MINHSFRIPKRGDARVAFLGVELQDAVIVIGSVFVGIFCGSALDMGNVGFLGIPIAGYAVNRVYIDWQSRTLPGAFRNFLFSVGLSGYSDALRSQKTIFIGDNQIINPAASQVVDMYTKKAKRSPANGIESA